MKFHRSYMKIEGGVRKSLKSGQILIVFRPKSGLKSKNSKFRFKDLMRTLPRNISMKFQRSNMKTGRQIRESLQSGPKRKKITSFSAKIGPKKQKFKIPLQILYADSPKEHSYEVSSL